MSRNTIARAAEEAAKRGLSVSVIVFESPDNDEAVDEHDVAYAAGAAPALATSPAVDTSAFQKRIAELETKLKTTAADKAKAEAAVSQLQAERAAMGSTLSADATKAAEALQAQVAELTGKLATAEQQLASAATATAAPTNGTGESNGAHAAPLAAFEGYAIDVLGLSEKAAKGVKKLKVSTIGELRTQFLAGALAEKRMGRAEIIEVAQKMLGQVPSLEDGPANGAAPAAPAAAQADVPVGVTPQSWMRQLEAARKKEARCAEFTAQAAELAAKAQVLQQGQLTPETQAELNQVSQDHATAARTAAVYHSQIVCLLWTMGLPHDLAKVQNVDGSLKAAGLPHLIEEVPAPSDQPAATAGA